MDNVIKCPVAYEYHDIWLNTSNFERVHIAVKQDDPSAFLSVDKDGWFFIPAWTEQNGAEKYVNDNQLNLIHEIKNIALTELCLLARAIMLNGVPMLVCGSSIAENTLSTYAPTPTIYSSVGSVWHYVEIDGKDLRTPDGELIIQLTASTLLARLYSEFPEFQDHLMNKTVAVKSIMFTDLVQREQYVYTDGELLNVRNGLATSKLMRTDENV